MYVIYAANKTNNNNTHTHHPPLPTTHTHTKLINTYINNDNNK